MSFCVFLNTAQTVSRCPSGPASRSGSSPGSGHGAAEAVGWPQQRPQSLHACLGFQARGPPSVLQANTYSPQPDGLQEAGEPSGCSARLGGRQSASGGRGRPLRWGSFGELAPSKVTHPSVSKLPLTPHHRERKGLEPSPSSFHTSTAMPRFRA